MSNSKRLAEIAARVSNWSVDSGHIRNDCEYLLDQLSRASELLRQWMVTDPVEETRAFLDGAE